MELIPSILTHATGPGTRASFVSWKLLHLSKQLRLRPKHFAFRINLNIDIDFWGAEANVSNPEFYRPDSMQYA
jgi:hypothetical protein